MTTGATRAGERFYAIMIEDVYTRRIVGAGVFDRCRAAEWVDALDEALRREVREGAEVLDLCCGWITTVGQNGGSRDAAAF